MKRKTKRLGKNQADKLRRRRAALRGWKTRRWRVKTGKRQGVWYKKMKQRARNFNARQRRLGERLVAVDLRLLDPNAITAPLVGGHSFDRRGLPRWN
jgi:hypothetical protein